MSIKDMTDERGKEKKELLEKRILKCKENDVMKSWLDLTQTTSFSFKKSNFQAICNNFT